MADKKPRDPFESMINIFIKLGKNNPLLFKYLLPFFLSIYLIFSSYISTEGKPFEELNFYLGFAFFSYVIGLIIYQYLQSKPIHSVFATNEHLDIRLTALEIQLNQYTVYLQQMNI